MIYAITDKLRSHLETARQQHGYAYNLSKESGLQTEQCVKRGMRSEYHRGRADGIRLALDVIAESMRREACR